MKSIVATVAAACILVLTGCNTVQGIGQDIQRGGQVLEGAAKK